MISYSAMCSATWLCCSNMLPLRGEQQATDYNPAKAYTLIKVRFGERGNQEWENILGPMASVVKLVLI